MMVEVDFVTFWLSQKLGAGEQTTRLLITLFSGYPLAFLYRSVLRGRPSHIQHLYFTVTGLALYYFNFGSDCVHPLINICAIWLLLRFLGGTAVSVAIAFVFNTAYLVIGYYYMMLEDYNISWRTAHCVLTLKLTAIVFDLYDGQKTQERLTADQKDTALHKSPTLLEMLGHVHFFGAFLVGPQFSMKRYQSFVNGSYSQNWNGGPPRNISIGMSRMMLGVLYIAAFQIPCTFVFKSHYMITPEFQEHSFLTKCAFIAVWGKLTLGKYVGCWLVAEGSCILTGVTYNGRDVNGNILWNGLSNVTIWNLELATGFKEMIAGFNTNTNYWMAKYVYKRLRFLGNKPLSQGIALFYLSLWHGVQSGYYMNFFLEFIMTNTEMQIRDLMQRFPEINRIYHIPGVTPALWTVKKVMLTFCVSYSLVSFVHLRWSQYMQVYSSVYYIGHVIFLLGPVICVALKMFVRRPIKPTSNGYHAVSNGVTYKEKSS